ncbi:MAG TPA: hypothetical protein VMJ70_11050 [Candidatus Sulfotelmatobacter sp.]|nr:hypothetical protein [Candidatus Sulfotelmatobacter sp.]
MDPAGSAENPRMHGCRRGFPRLGPGLGLALALIFGLAPRARAAEDRIHLDFRFGRQAERFQSPQADSLGLSVTQSVLGQLDCDFRVMDMPMKPQPPSLWVFTRATALDRVYVPGVGTPPVSGLPARSIMLDIVGGIGVTVPLGIVDKSRGAEFRLRYEGGVVIAASSGESFLQTSAVHMGFRRVGGVFDGSEMDVGYGHNDVFGPDAAAKRWSARTSLFVGIGPAPRVAPPPTPPGAKPTPATAATPAGDGRRPLRGFLELMLDTDGRPGPDSASLRVGLALDVGGALALLGGE